MKVDIRITTEEENELIITNHECDDMIYLTVGDNSHVIEVNVEELKLALRKLATK